jgi:hypothetical protein
MKLNVRGMNSSDVGVWERMCHTLFVTPSSSLKKSDEDLTVHSVSVDTLLFYLETHFVACADSLKTGSPSANNCFFKNEDHKVWSR